MQAVRHVIAASWIDRSVLIGPDDRAVRYYLSRSLRKDRGSRAAGSGFRRRINIASGIVAQGLNGRAQSVGLTRNPIGAIRIRSHYIAAVHITQAFFASIESVGKMLGVDQVLKGNFDQVAYACAERGAGQRVGGIGPRLGMLRVFSDVKAHVLAGAPSIGGGLARNTYGTPYRPQTIHILDGRAQHSVWRSRDLRYCEQVLRTRR